MFFDSVHFCIVCFVRVASAETLPLIDTALLKASLLVNRAEVAEALIRQPNACDVAECTKALMDCGV